jgi:hypothetical protein
MMPVLEDARVQLRLHAVGLDAAGEAVDELAANATVGAVLADSTPEPARGRRGR